MGFRLFCIKSPNKPEDRASDNSGQSGEIRAEIGNKLVAFKNVAPGAYYALCGTLIIGVSVYRGIELCNEGDFVTAAIGGHQQARAGTDDKDGGDKSQSKCVSQQQGNVTGELFGIDPKDHLDNMPHRLLRIIETLKIGEEEDLDNQEKEMLNIWVGKLKKRVTAQRGGAES